MCSFDITRKQNEKKFFPQFYVAFYLKCIVSLISWRGAISDFIDFLTNQQIIKDKTTEIYSYKSKTKLTFCTILRSLVASKRYFTDSLKFFSHTMQTFLKKISLSVSPYYNTIKKKKKIAKRVFYKNFKNCRLFVAVEEILSSTCIFFKNIFYLKIILPKYINKGKLIFLFKSGNLIHSIVH